MLSKMPAIPYFEVLVNGEFLTAYASRVEIIQKTNSHPVALLDVEYVGQLIAQGGKGIRNSWTYLKEQTPIAINYGMKPNYLGQFLGYVASYQFLRSGTDIGSNGLKTTCVRYTIVGTSQIMQSTKNVAWKNTSISTIASSIAVKNGFRAVIHPYTQAITYRLQNVSDFKFLSELADEIGYRFYVDNTDLYFVNPRLILDQSNLRSVPEFWSYNTPGLYDTIRKFSPIVGTITPDGGIVANRTVSGINTETGNVLTATTPYNTFMNPDGSPIAPTITKYYNQRPVDTYYEAKQKLAGDINNNIYWITADCELYGDFRVKPNTLVEFYGNSLPSTEAGRWLVQSATHIINMPAPTGSKVDADYTICAEVVRDQYYAATTVTVPASTSAVIQKVPPALVGGTWRSSNVGAQIHAS